MRAFSHEEITCSNDNFDCWNRQVTLALPKLGWHIIGKVKAS
jgi:hypothetical protein